MKSFATIILALANLAVGFPVESDGTNASSRHALNRRAIVNHDSLSPDPQTVQGGAIGAAIARFSPKIRIASGCEPYTAVDDQGNISGGLKPGGGERSNCGDPYRGQTYARAGTVQGKLCIMYSWYMPKDQPRSDTIGAHRHDWENIVVCTDPTMTTLTNGAASGHGKYKKTTSVPTDGTNVLCEYFTNFPTNHELQFTGDTRGYTKPIMDWDAMPAAMRSALQNADFGAATVPFKDGTFMDNLNNAQ
ncbi:hypothetical protein MCOR27_006813 [Pyricularia oryzae]|uniref:Uncharacterized protein n=1 Tax=Pyricularia oryzae TaxID=318829 RepID=A0A4P7MXM4_PYROR|nr:hypothetical protein MCOR01_005700 [Pyricularia oryzae]KAH9434913.1 hypothetical protein MCOR02_003879 [Pyricularia oryzae]KAI6260969.1 hypothetical protein MCOR19_002732 [Pyricularia oryzae]KAI6275757.1 hypothetical protein MCOR27_006813 [Pyricularia oryzae]KAI6326574.1 hypothetical protein MCOR29_003404 [Pyricularia oryzae]